MKAKLLIIIMILGASAMAQTNPVIIKWLQNRTGIKGRHYVNGNPTPINDNDSANVQQVFYSSNWSYIRTKGIPAYITGPFLDGNPSIATNQNAIFKFPLNPVQNTSGTYTATTGGNIGVFINGVALFDYRDGVAWNNTTNSLCGGPGNPPCPGGPGATMSWNRDAIVAERGGFDCSKGHPAMGNYHHHQNPSAFNLDLNVISNICNVYAADGLYAIDSLHHAPLIGFAYDGFPIYGAYAYKNANGTGGIVRMKSSYKLRNITTRTTSPTGTPVTPGPPVSATYPLGYFREDYEYVATSAATPDYLDEHNGRFCITPEYPTGIYCYFATVDANWNSAYPYVVGPTFYGVKNAVKVTSITEPVSQYVGGVVPVQLLNFNGAAKNGQNELWWITQQETNITAYEVESSDDGRNFHSIGMVNSKGNASVKQYYSFTDLHAAFDTRLYRLKIWAVDGSASYSQIISLGNRSMQLAVKIFPNPASDFIAVQVGGLVEQDMQVVLTNMNGQKVAVQTLYQGSSICFIETGSLYEGMYTLTVVDGKNRQSFKVNISR